MGKIVRKTFDQIRRSGGRIDRAKVLATTDAAIARQIAEDPDTAPLLHTLQPLIDVKALRNRRGMSQHEFARSLSIPVATVRNWEQKRRFPDAPAISLLRVFAAHPKTVADALK